MTIDMIPEIPPSSPSALKAKLVAGDLPKITPYWDEGLKTDRPRRIAFLQPLAALGLGGYRRVVRGYMGLFFLGKKNGDQRMVLDARAPNAMHADPPLTLLGTLAAVAGLDLSESTLEEAQGSDEPADPHAASVDLVDSFSRYTSI